MCIITSINNGVDIVVYSLLVTSNPSLPLPLSPPPLPSPLSLSAPWKHSFYSLSPLPPTPPSPSFYPSPPLPDRGPEGNIQWEVWGDSFPCLNRSRAEGPSGRALSVLAVSMTDGNYCIPWSRITSPKATCTAVDIRQSLHSTMGS